MTSENPHPQDPTEADARDELIGALLNDYFDRRERGEEITKDQFLADHPDYADALREHLSGLDLLKKAESSSSMTQLPGDETVEAGGSSATIRDTGDPGFPEITGYEIHKLIGRGGMGVVYKATQVSTKRQIALKVLLEGPLASEQARKRFEREIEVAAQLRHSNIIPIYDSGKCNGRMYYAMAYVRGTSLSDFLAAHRLAIEEKLKLFVKVCQAVRHAHQRGVMHRDLKPTNILVDADGEPHILDFGLAKASSHVDMNTSVSAQIVGTPAYMSPEQAAGDPAGVDTRTDIYSLGVVLYELLTGRMPYPTNVSMGKVLENIANAEPTPPTQLDRRISGELTAIVMKALEKNKDRRYQSLDIFQLDIEKFLKGEPISVKPATVIYLFRKTLWRHRMSVGTVAALAIVISTVGVIVRHYSRQLQQQIVEHEEQKKQIVQEREKLKRDKDDLERQRDLAAREYMDYQNFVEKYNPTLAKAAKTIAGGITNPYNLPELLAQGARELTPDESAAPSKIASLDPSAPIRFEPPAVSTKPQSPRPRETDYLGMIGETAQRVFTTGLPEAPTTRPATSQPAESPTTQPLSSAQFQADAGGRRPARDHRMKKTGKESRGDVN